MSGRITRIVAGSGDFSGTIHLQENYCCSKLQERSTSLSEWVGCNETTVPVRVWSFSAVRLVSGDDCPDIAFFFDGSRGR